jgi:hypothetical protein
MRYGREPTDSPQDWADEFRSTLFTQRMQAAMCLTKKNRFCRTCASDPVPSVFMLEAVGNIVPETGGFVR